ncbi:MAG: LCP family protein [Clostridia bacterium]|nr:LCP family protein [Clostridia bacterium]
MDKENLNEQPLDNDDFTVSQENIEPTADPTDCKADENTNPTSQKKRKLKLVLIVFLCVFLSIILVVVSVFFILAQIGKYQFRKGNTQITVSGIEDIVVNEDEVIYKDKTYVLNQNVVAILFMGIDKKDINEDLGYGKNGQADCLFVAALDTKTKAVKIIPVSRETLVDVNVYSSSGKYTGTKKQQICLAYSYGKTAEDSSKNVLTAVRRLFYGINISSFVTVDLRALEKFTQELGGVSLNCLEEMKIDGKTVKKGEIITLKGKSATTYIQSRGNDVEANNRRMLRQKQFLSALASKAGNEVINNFTKLGAYYNTVIPYSSTDLSFSQITYLVSSCISPDIGSKFEYISIEGRSVMGEKWVEFEPSQESLLEIVLDVFYVEKK